MRNEIHLGSAEDIRNAIAELQAEHQALEARLDGFVGRVWLSPQEEVERKHLQKLKLHNKDRISALTRRLDEAAVS